MKKIWWRIRMALTKIRHPKAGYYERMCLVAGYKKSDIDYWLKKEKENGVYASDSEIREDLCETEVSYWEE